MKYLILITVPLIALYSQDKNGRDLEQVQTNIINQSNVEIIDNSSDQLELNISDELNYGRSSVSNNQKEEVTIQTIENGVINRQIDSNGRNLDSINKTK